MSGLGIMISMGNLLEVQGSVNAAKQMYYKAYLGFQTAVSKSSSACQDVKEKIESINHGLGESDGTVRRYGSAELVSDRW